MSINREIFDSDDRQKLYSINQIAEFARVDREFIQECEHENLIQVTLEQGTKSYGQDTVRRLIRIRHLHRDSGLDLTAIDFILRLRRRIRALQRQMRSLEHRMQEREEELTEEIQRLRRQLARVSNRGIK